MCALGGGECAAQVAGGERAFRTSQSRNEGIDRVLDAIVAGLGEGRRERQECHEYDQQAHGLSDSSAPEMFLAKYFGAYDAPMRMLMSSLSAVLFLFLPLVACGGGETHTAPNPADFPSLQGRPVYSSALASAPADVSTIWPQVEEALESRITNAEDWARNRTQLIQRLDPEWGRLAQGEVDDRLFAALTRGLLYDDLATRVQSTERKAEAAAEARRAYAQCVREAPQATPVLQDWGSTCLERSTALQDLE